MYTHIRADVHNQNERNFLSVNVLILLNGYINRRQRKKNSIDDIFIFRIVIVSAYVILIENEYKKTKELFTYQTTPKAP